MNNEQIREVVKMTLDELDKRHLLKDPYQNVLKVVDKRLYKFFNGAKDLPVGAALRQLSDDPYIDTIYLQYRDGKTVEWIAEYYDKEVRTILRNKKRLITAIYERIKEE